MFDTFFHTKIHDLVVNTGEVSQYKTLCHQQEDWAGSPEPW